MNSKVSIAEILTEAWKIFWKFRVLWGISIAANCGYGIYVSLNEGASNLIAALVKIDPQQLPNFLKYMQPADVPGYFMARYGAWIAAGSVLLFGLLILFYYLSVVGRAAMIKGVSQADDSVQPKFGELWQQGGAYFWRIFWLDTLLLLPLTVWLTILAGGMWFGIFATAVMKPQENGMAVLLAGLITFTICGMCLMAVISLLLSVIAQQAYCAVVLDDLGPMAGLKRGWAVFKLAWLTNLLLSVILGIIGSVAGIAVSLPIQWLIAALGSVLTPALLGTISIVIYLPVLLVLYGLLFAYYQAAWTLLYRRLTAKPAER